MPPARCNAQRVGLADAVEHDGVRTAHIASANFHCNWWNTRCPTVTAKSAIHADACIACMSSVPPSSSVRQPTINGANGLNANHGWNNAGTICGS